MTRPLFAANSNLTTLERNEIAEAQRRVDEQHADQLKHYFGKEFRFRGRVIDVTSQCVEVSLSGWLKLGLDNKPEPDALHLSFGYDESLRLEATALRKHDSVAIRGRFKGFDPRGFGFELTALEESGPLRDVARWCVVRLTRTACGLTRAADGRGLVQAWPRRPRLSADDLRI